MRFSRQQEWRRQLATKVRAAAPFHSEWIAFIFSYIDYKVYLHDPHCDGSVNDSGIAAAKLGGERSCRMPSPKHKAEWPCAS